MRHDWVFDVLHDLRAYAQKNGLPLLACKADEALRVARAEVGAGCTARDAAGDGDCGEPPAAGRRAH